MSVRVGIVGASGYTGVELLRMLQGHPGMHVSWLAANRAAGEPIEAVWPGLTGIAGLAGRRVEAFDAAEAPRHCDAVFLALPHGVSAAIAPALLDAGLTVVDLGADFRLRDPALYQRAYGLAHPCPELLGEAVYGLVEISRDRLRGARLIASPGCYPTAVTLAAHPLVAGGLAGPWLVADCLSGISGAGRSPGPRNLYCEVAESAQAYGLAGTHRHTPEIEQTLGRSLTFTPHLVPMIRGMVATVHTATPEVDVPALLRQHWADEAMVVVRDGAPCTADVRGTNRAHLFGVWDRARGVTTVTCVIDNLVKGAAGQAIQALNVALGLPETDGLPLIPLLP